MIRRSLKSLLSSARSIRSCTAISRVVSSSAAAQAWQEYSNTDYSFTVMFPAAPQIATTTYQVTDGRSVPAHVYSARQNKGEFKVTVALENDADASALGEAGWGAGKLKSRLIYVTVGTGIGGGIILDGQLYRGADMAHPEISHHVIDPSGPDCSCGYRGCWESLATGPAMAAWFNANAAGDRRSAENLSAAQVCQLAKRGDELATRAVERETYYLGLGLANLINLFVPDVIVLGGSVMKSAALFLDGIRKVIRQGCRFVPYEKTELALASLGEDANLIGAARVWHHRYKQGVGQPS